MQLSETSSDLHTGSLEREWPFSSEELHHKLGLFLPWFPGCLSLSILVRLVLFVFVVAQTFEKNVMASSSNQKYRVP